MTRLQDDIWKHKTFNPKGCSPQSDDDASYTEEWLQAEYGPDDGSDFAIESSSRGETWHNWQVYIDLPSDVVKTGSDVRRW